MNGYEAVKKAIGDQAEKILAQTSEEAKKLFNEIKPPQVDMIAQRIALQYEQTKKVTDNFLMGLANEINPKSTIDSAKLGIIQAANTPPQSEQVETQTTQSTSVESTSILTPELMADPNFAIISRDEAKSKIDNSSSDVSEGLEGEVKLSVLNIQASLYRMAYNTIGKSVAPLPEQEYYNLSSAATLSFLQLVSSKSKAEGGSAKLKSSTGVFGGMEKMTKEFNDSSFGELFDVVTNGSKMIKGGEKLLGEYEDLIDSIVSLRNDPRSLALQHPTSAQQLIGATIQQLPINERINKITAAGSVNGSIQSILSTLKLEPKSLGILATLFEKMGGGNTEALQKMEKLTSGIDDLTNQGLDKLVDSELAPLLGSFKLDGEFMKMIAKFFENSWVRGFMMSMGIDTKQLLKQLTGELDASQKLKREVAMKRYESAAKDPTNTTLVQILGLNDPEDGVYKSLLGFSIEGLQQGLIDSKSQPHPSVLLYLTEDNATLRNKYFVIQADQSYARNTTNISSEDLSVCTQGFVTNKMIMSAPHTKSEFLGITFKSHTDYASALVGYWLKGNRGMKGVSELKLIENDEKKEERMGKVETLTSTGPTETLRSAESASEGFAKLGKKLIAPASLIAVKDSLYTELNPNDLDLVINTAIDPEGQYKDALNQMNIWLTKKAQSKGYETSGRAKEIAYDTAVAENASKIYRNDLNPNNDAGGGSSDGPYQFNAGSAKASRNLTQTHFKNGKELMGITQDIPKNHIIGQMIAWFGGHLVQKEHEGKDPFKYLFELKASDPMNKFTDGIRDNIQIGSKKEGLFKTDYHVRKMMNSKVSDLFDFAPTTIS